MASLGVDSMLMRMRSQVGPRGPGSLVGAEVPTSLAAGLPPLCGWGFQAPASMASLWLPSASRSEDRLVCRCSGNLSGVRRLGAGQVSGRLSAGLGLDPDWGWGACTGFLGRQPCISRVSPSQVAIIAGNFELAEYIKNHKETDVGEWRKGGGSARVTDTPASGSAASAAGCCHLARRLFPAGVGPGGPGGGGLLPGRVPADLGGQGEERGGLASAL